MILERLEIPVRDFEARTGWQLKPEGACKGDVCVPLGAEHGAVVSAERLSEKLGMPLVRDEKHGLWALGPESLGGRALTSVEAPDLELDDLDGHPFRLASLRGRKVCVVAWAPW